MDRLSKFASVAVLEPKPEDREKKVFIEYLLDHNSEKKKEEVLERHCGTVKQFGMDPIVALPT